MNPNDLLYVYRKRASEAYRDSDKKKWTAALWCSRVVGNYDRGKTIGLADDMGVSVDTVEDLAHAYMLFEELGKEYRYRQMAFTARRMPFVYLSHFRALYDARNKYNLTLEQIADLLHSILAGEGSISSRDVDRHAQDRFGDTRDWTWYAQKAMRDLTQLQNQPDLPAEGRQLVNDLFSWMGDHA